MFHVLGLRLSKKNLNYKNAFPFFLLRADRIDNGISAYENSERIKNITIALQNVLDNSSSYDIRLRPRFGGKIRRKNHPDLNYHVPLS